MANPFSILAAVYNIGTSYLGYKAGKKASESSIRADNERIAASKIQQQRNSAKVYRDKIRNIAQGRVARARVVNAQSARNMSGSAAGQIGGISSTVGSNYGFQSYMGNLADQATANLFQASIFSTAANKSLFKGQDYLNLGKIATKTASIFD
tara:strand:+ start:1402 stop:1857 length:456 start_codon:yes stop_codon:yes gene_type:complete